MVKVIDWIPYCFITKDTITHLGSLSSRPLKDTIGAKALQAFSFERARSDDGPYIGCINAEPQDIDITPETVVPRTIRLDMAYRCRDGVSSKPVEDLNGRWLMSAHHDEA